MKNDNTKLYRRIEVSLLTKLDDGTLLFPDEVAYVEATPKQLAYAHPRCKTCMNRFNDNCPKQNAPHPEEYCSLHTSLLETTNEIN
jgi:hypothetical protein